jgi:hypothetical protein
MTTPVTAQGPAFLGMSTTQQGYAPGFPPPLGLEQYFGQPQQYGGFPAWYGSPQQFPMQSQFPGMQSQFPGQQLFGQHHAPIQQIVPALVSQLLPIAQQVILPQVVATAAQQIPWYLQQLVTQQLTSQQSQFGQVGQVGQNQFGRPYPGIF